MDEIVLKRKKMAIEKITTVTLRQKVYDRLRTIILNAELLPGEVINLRGLAEQFGVSILPVREAVWQLESEKILVVESNKSIQVNHLTKEEFKEVLELRLLLESEAITKACHNRTTSAIAKVARTLEAMQRSAGVNQKVYIQKNDQFHSNIYSYSNSPLLIELIERLRARVNPYIYIHAVKDRDLAPAVSFHQEMFNGFSEGNINKATAALNQDLVGAAAVIMTHL